MPEQAYRTLDQLNIVEVLTRILKFNNLAEAAESLGVCVNTLYNYLNEWGLTKEMQIILVPSNGSLTPEVSEALAEAMVRAGRVKSSAGPASSGQQIKFKNGQTQTLTPGMQQQLDAMKPKPEPKKPKK